ITIDGDPAVFPLAHRARLEVALAHRRDAPTIDLSALPDRDRVAAGWRAQIAGLGRMELPPGREGHGLARAATYARCALLLDGPVHPDDDPSAFLIGLDQIVRLGESPDGDRSIGAAPTVDEVEGSPLVIALVEDRLARRVVDSVALLPHGFPSAWLGHPLEVHDLFLGAAGPISFAVRWHGERPAVLWEHEGYTLTSGADPDWTSSATTGEALWAAPSGDVG
ncbi:MAG: hypothetical protein EBR65_05210, partial [Actinobacteria bacterium]|nr:hypothetical protein [Actinomycetota bacterium]